MQEPEGPHRKGREEDRRGRRDPGEPKQGRETPHHGRWRGSKRRREKREVGRKGAPETLAPWPKAREGRHLAGSTPVFGAWEGRNTMRAEGGFFTLRAEQLKSVWKRGTRWSGDEP